ncbi:MAG: hypothetical protein KTR32_20315, partial [Granulosicoccus sp.]|nr:hypothetical protein [Granulosicoccus sp.]
YRGRGRQTGWVGRARFNGSEVKKLEKVNAWNPERLLALNGTDMVEWDAMTTGNYGGFDVWLDEDKQGAFDLHCNQGELKVPLAEIGINDEVLETGGLEKQIRVFRLPEEMSACEMQFDYKISLATDRDNPLWICVYTEDGFQAWSSPVFVFSD